MYVNFFEIYFMLRKNTRINNLLSRSVSSILEANKKEKKRVGTPKCHVAWQQFQAEKWNLERKVSKNSLSLLKIILKYYCLKIIEKMCFPNKFSTINTLEKIEKIKINIFFCLQKNKLKIDKMSIYGIFEKAWRF